MTTEVWKRSQKKPYYFFEKLKIVLINDKNLRKLNCSFGNVASDLNCSLLLLRVCDILDHKSNLVYPVFEISIEEWTVYFKKLLGGVSSRVLGERRKVKVGGTEEMDEISREEVNCAIAKLKRNKAIGEDGMENEALKFGGGRIRQETWELCNKVWRGEGWPKLWRTGLVIPLLKKGGGRKVEDYRGITLMPVSYKIYVEVLRKREEIRRSGRRKRKYTTQSNGIQEADGDSGQHLCTELSSQ